LIDPTEADTTKVVTEETTLTALEERQNLLAHHVRLIARGMSVGLFVFGSQGGLGKSPTVLRTLAEEAISPVLINSHIAPLALYASLYYKGAIAPAPRISTKSGPFSPGEWLESVPGSARGY